MPFVLGMSFLSAAKAIVEFGNYTMQIGCNTLQGMEQQPAYELHAMVMQMAKAYKQFGYKDVLCCFTK